MNFFVLVVFALATPMVAFSPARRLNNLRMSAESRLLGIAAETKLLSRIADSGVLNSAEKAGLTFASLETIITTADEQGLVDTAVKLIESPLAEPAVLVLSGRSPFVNAFRPKVAVSDEETKSVLLKKISEKKLLSLIAKRGLLGNADTAGLRISDLAPLLKLADELDAVGALAETVDAYGPTLVQFAPRALPLASGVLGLFGSSGGSGSSLSLNSISFPSASNGDLSSVPKSKKSPAKSAAVTAKKSPAKIGNAKSKKTPTKNAAVTAKKAPAKVATVKSKKISTKSSSVTAKKASDKVKSKKTSAKSAAVTAKKAPIKFKSKKTPIEKNAKGKSAVKKSDAGTSFRSRFS